MSSIVDDRAASPTGGAHALRLAILRVQRAATAYVVAPQAAELPLGDFRADELRMAALRMLALLAPEDDGRLAEAAAEEARQARHVVATLQHLDLRQISGSDRSELAGAVAGLHAALVDTADADVTRTLLDRTPVGPHLAALVFGTDPSHLDPDAQVSYCQAAQRLESAAHARLGAGMISFAGANPRHTQYWVEGDEYELTDVRASELASALAWSGSKARGAVQAARTLQRDLEGVADSAAAGSVQPAALSAIADGAQILTASIDEQITAARATLHAETDPSGEAAQRLWDLTTAREELIGRYDGALSSFATSHTPAETRRKVRDVLAKLDPEGFEARRSRARDLQSGVELRALPDAMAMLTAVMPAEQATACYRAIDGAARSRAGGDPDAHEAPIGVRRSQAMFAFCARSDAPIADAPAMPGHGLHAHVDLVMTLDSFLGLADTAAECVGTGPIPAAAARELLADAALVTFRRVLVEPSTGHALDVGVQRYTLSTVERDRILARDRVCRYPGCHQPAYRCECDHALPYEEGGKSRTDNLGALCRRHHQEKTHGGWRIEESAADGSCIFISPLGRRYPHAPESLLPWADFDPPPPDDDFC